MEFVYALEALKNGKKVRCPEWLGYWKIEDGTIMMHCKDGRVLKITDTEDIFYTLGFIVRKDWEVIDDDYTYTPATTIRFEEALRYLRMGKRVARRGWNGKGQYVYYTKGSTAPYHDLKRETYNHYTLNETREIDHENVSIKGHLDLKNAQDEIIVGWAPSQSDLMAEDWFVIE